MIKNEILIFLIIGLINTLVGLSSTYLFFDLIQLNYWLSTFIGNLIGMVVSYILNKKFTFKNEESVKSSLLKFFLVVFLCYYVSYWIGLRLSNMVVILLSIFKPHTGELSILFGAGLYTISNFIGQKYIVFKPKQRLKEESI
jgi:putative flippase GtrA